MATFPYWIDKVHTDGNVERFTQAITTPDIKQRHYCAGLARFGFRDQEHWEAVELYYNELINGDITTEPITGEEIRVYQVARRILEAAERSAEWEDAGRKYLEELAEMLGISTLPPVPIPRAHYDETGFVAGTAWNNTGSESSTGWNMTDQGSPGDPILDPINGHTAGRTLTTRMRCSTQSLSTEPRDIFLLIETDDVTTGQGILDGRSNLNDAGHVYLQGGNLIMGTQSGSQVASIPVATGMIAIWMRWNTTDSSLTVIQDTGITRAEGSVDTARWSWTRAFGGLGAPIGQLHYPGKIGEIILHEGITELVGLAQLIALWLKFEGGEVPIPPPTIDTQPVPLTVTEPAGGEFTIEISTAINGVPLFYLWQADVGDGWEDAATALSDAAGDDTDTLTINSTIYPDDIATVRCRVRSFGPEGGGGQVYSDAVALTVNGVLPVIDTQPDDLNIDEPDGGEFVVETSHPTGADLYYLWQVDVGNGWENAEVALSDASGQATTTLTLASTIPGDTGTVRCRIRAYEEHDNGYQVFTNVVDLTVDGALPVIDTQPISDTVTEPDGTSFTIEISHINPDAPLYTMWQARLDSGDAWDLASDVLSDVEDANVATMVINSTIAADDCEIRCICRAYENNNTYMVPSDIVTLTVEALPTEEFFHDFTTEGIGPFTFTRTSEAGSLDHLDNPRQLLEDTPQMPGLRVVHNLLENGHNLGAGAFGWGISGSGVLQHPTVPGAAPDDLDAYELEFPSTADAWAGFVNTGADVQGGHGGTWACSGYFRILEGDAGLSAYQSNGTTLIELEGITEEWQRIGWVYEDNGTDTAFRIRRSVTAEGIRFQWAGIQVERLDLEVNQTPAKQIQTGQYVDGRYNGNAFQDVPKLIAELLKPNGGAGSRPLPVASQWGGNAANSETTPLMEYTVPKWQCRLLFSGYPVLPHFGSSHAYNGGTLPDWTPSRGGTHLIKQAAKELRSWGMPICYGTQQWDRCFGHYDEIATLPEATNPNFLSTDTGIEVGRSDATPPNDDWWIFAGQEYLNKDPNIKFLMEMYPDPPRVFCANNNEQPRTSVRVLEAEGQRYRDTVGDPGVDTQEVRDYIQAEYIRLYGVVHDSWLATLPVSWRDVHVTIGYTAGEGVSTHSWSGADINTYGWNQERLTHLHGSWPGISDEVYARLKDSQSSSWKADFAIRNYQVEACLPKCYHDWAMETQPDMWLEISTWDGGIDGEDNHIAAGGGSRSYERSASAFTQTLWINQPRTQRSYIGSTDDQNVNPQDALQAQQARTIFSNSIREIWDTPKLEDYWVNGELVLNETSENPYHFNIDGMPYENNPKWWLLDCSTDPTRPWVEGGIDRVIPVTAVAYVLGTTPNRTWMIYTHACLGEVVDVDITIPDYGDITLTAPNLGQYWELDEGTGNVTEIVTL